MARVWMSPVYFVVFFGCVSLSSLVDSLSLSQQTRMKPTNEPTGGSPSVSTKAPKDDSGVAIYRVYNRDTDATCILLKTDALIEVNFKLHGLDEQADAFIPENAMVQGHCVMEDMAKISLGWPNYSLTLIFAKTPGGERWYLASTELTVRTDADKLQAIKTRDKTIKLYSRNMYLPTPVGKSYSCDEVDIPLQTDKADHPPSGVHGTLLLRALQVQAFMYRSENFSAPFECTAQRSFRSETAPIAVGSTLAIAALATVTGYGVFRYFRVKNVQYNTME